jgi:hypothetical protein
MWYPYTMWYPYEYGDQTVIAGVGWSACGSFSLRGEQVVSAIHELLFLSRMHLPSTGHENSSISCLPALEGFFGKSQGIY